MKLKPWYDVVKPREDLREGRPLDASEFAVHLDKVRLKNPTISKLYGSDYRVQKADIDSFFTASGKKPFTHRIIVTTTSLWSDHAEAALRDQHTPVTKIENGERRVILRPVNTEFAPIVVAEPDLDSVRVFAELVEVIGD